MTTTDFVGSVIDRLLERRHGAPYSPKWWKRYHDQTHQRTVMLACPECPDAAELGRQIRAGRVVAASFNDFRAAMEASDGGEAA